MIFIAFDTDSEERKMHICSKSHPKMNDFASQPIEPPPIIIPRRTRGFCSDLTRSGGHLVYVLTSNKILSKNYYFKPRNLD